MSALSEVMLSMRLLPLMLPASLLLSLSLSCSDSEPNETAGDGDGDSSASGGSPSSNGGNAGASNAGTGGAEEEPTVRCEWARGPGGQTLGGRGGKIVKVTTLATGGPGSLYAALQETGPRVIVFEVGGVIDLQKATLPITSPHVTIAGQTAPSPGITLIRGGMRISTHDVVIQHIAVRPGEAGEEKMSGWEPDGISSASGAYNLVIDHVSVTWGVDENLSASGDRFTGANVEEWRQNTTHDVTFSNNLVAEALLDSTHTEGPHSKGSLMHDNVTGALIWGSMYVSNYERNPLFKGGSQGMIANNLVINPGIRAMRYNLVEGEWTGHDYVTGILSIVGNDVRHGDDTDVDVPLLQVTGVGPVEVYFDDNLAVDLAGEPISNLGDEAGLAQELTEPKVWYDGLEVMGVENVEDYVVPNVGSRPWDRDPIDARIVADALAGDATIIDSEQEVGGYPERAPTEAAFDPEDWDLDCMEPLAGY